MYIDPLLSWWRSFKKNHPALSQWLPILVLVVVGVLVVTLRGSAVASSATSGQPPARSLQSGATVTDSLRCLPMIHWGGATVTQDCGPGATDGFTIKIHSGGAAIVSWYEFCGLHLPLHGSQNFSTVGNFVVRPSSEDVDVMQGSVGCELHVAVEGDSKLIMVNMIKNAEAS